MIRSVFAHELDRFGPEFPRGREYRKHWEVAMAVRALRDFGALHDRAEVLGVGAGNEPTLFWLTNHVRRVFATDLYLQGDGWSCSAHNSMLINPAPHWPAAWNPRRLVVQHMNALDLQYDDDSFDAIFSSSSIEHFGGPAEIRRAMAEMHRVLKPGGVLSVSTEFRLEGPPPGLPGVFLFDADDLEQLILGDLPWQAPRPRDLTLSPATAPRRSASRTPARTCSATSPRTATSSSTGSTGAITRTSPCATATTPGPASTWRCQARPIKKGVRNRY